MMFLIWDEGMIQARNRDHLIQLIRQRLLRYGDEVDLNDIDVSGIENMSYLFKDSPFNGDISGWNVSNVQIMTGMFGYSAFQGDISQWDTSKVMDLSYMFRGCRYSGDLASWNLDALLYHQEVFDVFHDSPLGYLGVLEGKYSFPQEHPKASEFQAMSVVCEGLEMEPPQIAMYLYRAMNDSSLHMPEDTSGLAF